MPGSYLGRRVMIKVLIYVDSAHTYIIMVRSILRSAVSHMQPQ